MKPHVKGEIMKKIMSSLTVFILVFVALALTGCPGPNNVSTGSRTATAPGVVRNFTATPGDSQVTLSWTAPSSSGGSAIIRYEVSSNNGAAWVTSSSNTSHTFTGLTNGTLYTFKVRAVNAVGAGTESTQTATPSSGSSSHPLGPTLTLSGQVYILDDTLTFPFFTGSRTVVAFFNDYIDTSGSINNGQFSYSVGTPSGLTNAEDFLGYLDMDNQKINPPDAKMAIIDPELHIGDIPLLYDDEDNIYIFTGEMAFGTFTATSQTLVMYIYTDQNVTWSADRTVINHPFYDEVINAFNVDLETGWNAITITITSSGSTWTQTYSAGIPADSRWLLAEYDD